MHHLWMPMEICMNTALVSEPGKIFQALRASAGPFSRIIKKTERAIRSEHVCLSVLQIKVFTFRKTEQSSFSWWFEGVWGSMLKNSFRTAAISSCTHILFDSSMVDKNARFPKSRNVFSSMIFRVNDMCDLYFLFPSLPIGNHFSNSPLIVVLRYCTPKFSK